MCKLFKEKRRGAEEMTDDIKVLRKRAMYNPQSLTKDEWNIIHEVAFSTPKKDFSDNDPIVSSPIHKHKKKGAWW